MHPLLLLANLTYLNATDTLDGVIETPVDKISYQAQIYNENIGIQNVTMGSDRLHLRSKIDGGAMIRWNVPNKSPEWSFSFDFNELNLDARETATISLFYTTEKPTIGHFNGGLAKFHGFSVALRFSGKALELLYTHNNGRDYTNIGDQLSTIDSVNPMRFFGVERLRMKVICTSKNFKIELYDGEKIIYDRFRFFSKEHLANAKAGGYLSLVTQYIDVSSGKAFDLYQARLYQRMETAKYDPTKMHSEDIPITVRAKEDISHSNVDVQDLIFNMGALDSFIRSMVGDLPDTVIVKSEKELLREVETLLEKTRRLRRSSTGGTSPVFESSKKINNLDIRLKALSRKLSEIDFLIDASTEKGIAVPRFLPYAGVCVGVCAVARLVQRMYAKASAKEK